MQIRDAQEKDIRSILEIINFEILNTTALYHYEPRTLNQQLEWFKDKKKSNFPVLVAEDESGIIGFGSYGTFAAAQVRPPPAWPYHYDGLFFQLH